MYECTDSAQSSTKVSYEGSGTMKDENGFRMHSLLFLVQTTIILLVSFASLCIVMHVCFSLQYGYHFLKKCMTMAPASATWLPTSHIQGCSKLTLSVRSLQIGTLKMTFRGSVTVSLWPFSDFKTWLNSYSTILSYCLCGVAVQVFFGFFQLSGTALKIRLTAGMTTLNCPYVWMYCISWHPIHIFLPHT